MTTALRPLSTGELLDRTFTLYRSHFVLFLAIFALPHLMVLAYQCIGITFQSPSPTPQFSNVLLTLFWSLGAGLLSLVVSAASQAATVVAVSEVHLDRSASIMSSFSRIKGQIVPVLLMSLLIGIAAGAACLALIVPGIILLVMWSLAVPAKVLENRGILDAMSRSMDLTKGSRGRIFVIWLLFFLLQVILGLLMRWPLEMAAGVTSVFALQRSGAGYQASLLVSQYVAQCLAGPLATIAFSLVYYDERVRKEAFDLQLMMTALDAPPVPGSPAQVGA